MGFYLMERGVEANPDKFRTVLKMEPRSSKGRILKLNRMMTVLSRFISRSAQHALPFFRLLRKVANFEWTQECGEAFDMLKTILSQPPVLSRPMAGETLYLYLAISAEAFNAILVREIGTKKNLVYFCSKSLAGPETRYQKIEEVALTLKVAARKLRRYFLAHSIVVRTNQPLKNVLFRPDLAGRMTKWSIELSELDITFEVRKALKAQTFADFLEEFTPPTAEPCSKWTLFTDGSSNIRGGGVGAILESAEGLTVELSLRFRFSETNNQAEYKVVIAGLDLARDLGAREVQVKTDSQLVVFQVRDNAQVKDALLQKNLCWLISLIR